MTKLFFYSLVFVLALPFQGVAQTENKGMHFSKAANWQEVLAEAKTSNKYIFVDAYTTWCGPCKYMSVKIFPQEETGTYFNDKFVNVKLQMDSTGADNDHVKSWYSDAKSMMKQYAVTAYPTYLFFSPNGELVHRFVGAYADPASFIEKASVALNPDKQYYSLLKEYEKGHYDSAFLHTLAEAAREANDGKKADEIATRYITSLKNPCSTENIDMLLRFTNSSTAPGFEILSKQAQQVNSLKGERVAENKLIDVLMREEMRKLSAKDAAAPEWTSIASQFEKSSPLVGKEALAKTRVVYYSNQKDWKNFGESAKAYISKYGKSLTPQELNDYAWQAFENSSDPRVLAAALEWSKKSLEKESDGKHYYLDTYANLLYKTGDKKKAIEWEEKALQTAKASGVEEGNLKVYMDALEKMKNGVKTW